MQSIHHLCTAEIEAEVSRLISAFATRDRRIGKDIIIDLRLRFFPEDVAGLMLVALERLLWVEPQAFVWVVESLLPASLLKQIRELIQRQVCQTLIAQGHTPGEGFSADARGQLLLAPALRQQVGLERFQAE